MGEPNYHEYLCKSTLHKWKDKTKAERCCNGWTHIMVPLGYGLPINGEVKYEVRKELKLWKPYLIEDSDTVEMQRILSLSPDWILRGDTQ